MRATLEFNLPEDRSEFAIASRAVEWALVVFEVDNHLRGLLKNIPPDWSQETYDAVDDVRAHLHNHLRDRGLSLDDLE